MGLNAWTSHLRSERPLRAAARIIAPRGARPTCRSHLFVCCRYGLSRGSSADTAQRKPTSELRPALSSPGLVLKSGDTPSRLVVRAKAGVARKSPPRATRRPFPKLGPEAALPG